jgi:hypothetical protein
MASYGKNTNSWTIPNGIFNPFKKGSFRLAKATK